MTTNWGNTNDYVKRNIISKLNTKNAVILSVVGKNEKRLVNNIKHSNIFNEQILYQFKVQNKLENLNDPILIKIAWIEWLNSSFEKLYTDIKNTNEYNFSDVMIKLMTNLIENGLDATFALNRFIMNHVENGSLNEKFEIFIQWFITDSAKILDFFSTKNANYSDIIKSLFDINLIIQHYAKRVDGSYLSTFMGHILLYAITHSNTPDNIIKDVLLNFYSNGNYSTIQPIQNPLYPNLSFSGYNAQNVTNHLSYLNELFGSIKGIVPVLNQWFVVQGGKRQHSYYHYNNRKYKIYIGSRGGKYIMSKGKKIYI